MCTSGRGQVLSPWPNRVEDGSYEYDGRRHQLPIDEPEQQTQFTASSAGLSWEVARYANRVGS